MIVTILDIQDIFSKLLNGETTRDEADRWAFKIYSGLDSINQYSLCPAKYDKLILEALQYLWGIDDLDENREYLYSYSQIKSNFEKKWKVDITKELIEEISSMFILAEPIGENWVLCPECDEAFEVDENQGVITCTNVVCKAYMNNPYAKVFPKKDKT